MASELPDNPMGCSDLVYTPQPVGVAKSWEEMKGVVKETRKLVTSLACRVPSSFTFRTQQTEAGPITRLYFLGIPPKQRESTLLYINVPTSAMSITPMLQWCALLEGFSSQLSSNTQMSKEEQLLRERKRLGVFGITSYEVSDGGKLLFPACNSLFTCMDNDMSNEDQLFPESINTNVPGARMDPKICPSNPDLVAFIHSNDLWVVNLKTGQEVRLTHANKGTGNLTEDSLSAGVPSFVVQEEFDRYTGYWWQPGSHGPVSTETGDVGASTTYRILYEEVDESEVEIIKIHSEKGTDEYRYPRPGKPNAQSQLKIVQFTVDNEGKICKPVETRCLYENLSSLFLSMEYVIRAGWTPDAKYVHCQLLNRRQTSLTLALIPVECFVPEDVLKSASGEAKKYPPVHIIHEENSKIWINVHDVLHFLPQTEKDVIDFMWLSESSGYRHLYKISSKLAQNSTLRTSVSEDETERPYSEDVKQCERSTVTTITAGSWEVSPKEIWLDEKRQLVYFIGLKDTPLETHLYVTSFSNPGDIMRLTELGYSHAVSFNKERNLFVSVYSSTKCSPMSTLYQIIHSETSINTKPLGVLMPSSPCPEYTPPEMFSYKAISGYTMHGMYYKPHNCQPGVKYPTVLFVYGGPHVQLVSNSFKGLKFLRLHTLASQGYAVVLIDNRGSCSRGLKFESHIKNRLGTTEIEDQVEGLQWLASQVDFIDESRVAIHGWSYGGYLSLMGLAQRPDVFKVAIAGAPVVNWNLYDSGYTERYMDLPESNTYGYQQGNVLSYVNDFPVKENRLLIVHGLKDENVHFLHSSVLVNALVRVCKPHMIQVYPNERHGIRNHEAGEHYQTLVLSFLQNNL